MKTFSSIGRFSRHEDGFTLLEVFVVAAILGMLLTLGVAGLSPNKNSARTTRCASNTRQFSAALVMFADENQGKLPAFDIMGGAWPWDLPAPSGNVLTQWISWRSMYCPGTSGRFTDQDNQALWNFASTTHVVGYALSAPGSGLNASNQNRTLLPPVPVGVANTAPSPSRRVLLADATISAPGQTNPGQRYLYNWTFIFGGFAKPHTSPHLKGSYPSGGNLGMMDGHVDWKPFPEMQCRVTGGSVPGFWW